MPTNRLDASVEARQRIQCLDKQESRIFKPVIGLDCRYLGPSRDFIPRGRRGSRRRLKYQGFGIPRQGVRPPWDRNRNSRRVGYLSEAMPAAVDLKERGNIFNGLLSANGSAWRKVGLPMMSGGRGGWAVDAVASVGVHGWTAGGSNCRRGFSPRGARDGALRLQLSCT